MQFGNFNLEIINAGNFKLDGGTIFGPVPKVIWEKLYPLDELNRINMSTKLRNKPNVNSH